MASLTARLVRRVVRSTLKPAEVGDDFVADLRRRLGGGTAPTLLPGGVGRRPATADEAAGEEGEWVGVPAAHRHVLYLHGGYYLAGTPATYRNLTGRIAAGIGADVLVPDYRLAPEHPYPAAVDDASAAYRALLDSGADPARTAIAGDSAGGGLTAALLLRLKSEGLPLPAAAVLFSPWLDLTCSGESMRSNDETDDLLTAEALRAAAGLYAGETAPEHPEVSPLFGDLVDLPPLYVAVDESETLLDDSLRYAERATAAGVTVELHRTTGLFHVWPVLAPLLPEARTTVREVVEFLDRHLAS